MDLLNLGVTPETYKNLYIDSELAMMWHLRTDPRFSYHTYIPKSVYNNPAPTFRIMCFVHGTGRTFEKYRQTFSKFADENNLVLLFPLFPGGLIDKDDFNSYKLLSYHGVRYDQILLSMVDDLAERYTIDKEKIYLYGWSGGGQFVHRFLYLHPERLAALVIGAPGRITYLDDSEDFYWGIRNFETYFNRKPEIEKMKRVPIQLMIGENDTKFIGESKWGNNRMDRIINYRDNLKRFEIKSSLMIIPGIEHKGYDEIKAEFVMDFFKQFL